jgi:hypothetical protein
VSYRVLAVGSLSLLIVCSFVPDALALNESTHELVNRQAALLSDLDSVLKNGLGFGIDRTFNGQSALRWLELGGRYEDQGSAFQFIFRQARYARHFHDPLQPWDMAGLSKPILGHFESSVRWMQRTDQDTQAVGGKWSWQDARDHYWKALTSSTSMTREQEFADTFRALGQIMHLVTDASVPEHTRNDAHPLGVALGNYEYWVSNQHGLPGSTVETNFILNYLSNPFRPDPAILRQSTGDSLAPVPVARLIDTDTYRGRTTGPNVTFGRAIGIAEVANANFFSEDTGNDPSPYPFPDRAALERVNLTTPRGRVRAYFNKAPNDGLVVAPVLAECVLYESSVRDGVAQPVVTNCTDDLVWSKVADQMLPRAVGYSAAVLDYFFRGRLEVQMDYVRDANGRALRDERGDPRFGLRIVNRTPGETMSGEFQVRYDTVDGSRERLTAWSLTLDPDASTDLLPLPSPTGGAPAEPKRYLVVFQGNLGAEPGAVAAQWVGLIYYLSFNHNETSDGRGWDEKVVTAGPPTESFYLEALQGSGAAVYGSDAQLTYRTGPMVTSTGTSMRAIYRSLEGAPGNLATLSISAACSTWMNWLGHPNDSWFTWSPVSAQIVEFEEPPDLAAFKAYTWSSPPIPKHVLYSFTLQTWDPPTQAEITIGDARFLGVHLVTQPAPAPLPPSPAPRDGANSSASGCQVSIDGAIRRSDASQ